MKILKTILISLTMILAAGSALAEECLDYCDHLRLIAQSAPEVDLALTSIVRRGDLAYVTAQRDESAELRIYDLSVAESPTLLGVQVLEQVYPFSVLEVQLVGDLAYLVNDWQPMMSGNLFIVDVSDPANPVMANTVEYFPTVDDFTIADGYLFTLTNGDMYQVATVEVWSLADPLSPDPVGYYTLPLDWWRSVRGIDVLDGYAYLPASEDGLIVLNVTNPAYPHTETILPLGNVQNIALADGMLYARLSQDTQNLIAFDLGTPGAPAELGRIDLPAASTIYPYGDRAYVTYNSNGDAANGFEVVDISDPSAMQPLGRFGGGSGGGMAPTAEEIFILSGSSIQVVTLGDGTPAERITSADSWDTYTQHVMMKGRLAFLGGQNPPTVVVDLSDPENPQELAEWDFVVQEMLFDGDLAYALTDWENFQVLDIADPVKPVLLGSVPMSFPRELVRQGDLVYVADYDEGLKIVDVSDPNAPVLVGEYMDTNCKTVAVVGDYAYLAGWWTGLDVIDVSDPAAPLLVANLPSVSIMEELETDGEYLYLAASNDGLLVYDLSNPAAPALLPGNGMAYYPMVSIALNGDYIYAANSRSGMTIVDVTDPAQPWVCGNLATTWGGSTEEIAIGAGLIVSSEGYSGYSIAWPQCGNLTAVAEAPVAPVALSCYPNPFNPKTSVRLSLPERGFYRVEVFDASGRLASTLAARDFEAGGHVIEWNGRDDGGRAVASGMYLIRAQGAEYFATAKAVMLQ